MNAFSLKTMTTQVVIAAIYVVFVLVFQFMSFQLIQFRIAELLMVLVLFNPKHMVGLTIGCFLANLIGGAILVDVIFGTLATTLAAALMILLKSKPGIALIIPAIINGIVVGLILTYGYLLGPLWMTMGSVFIGEFVVMYTFGFVTYRVIKNNPHILELLSSQH
jgi:uncharacterized membrane protein